MTAAEAAEMIRHSVEIIFVWCSLYARIIRRHRGSMAVFAGWKRGRHIICEVEASQWEVNECLDLIGNRTTEREAF